MLCAGAGQLAVRISGIPEDVRDARDFAASVDDVFELERRAGRETLLSCRERVTVSDLLIETALAWRLDLALSDVGSRPRPRLGVAIVPRARPARGPTIATAGEWRAVRLPCRKPQPAVSSASALAIAGVAGAAR